MRILGLLVSTIVLCYVASAGAANHLSDEKLAVARSLLESNDLDTGIVIDQVIDYGNGGGVVSGLPLHAGLPVFDGRKTYHFAPGGTYVKMPAVEAVIDTDDLAGLEIDKSALIDAEAAIFAVKSPDAATMPETIDPEHLAAVQRCAEDAGRLNYELGILARRPVWQIRCKYSRSPGIFVDAEGGALVPFETDSAGPALPMSLPIPLPE